VIAQMNSTSPRAVSTVTQTPHLDRFQPTVDMARERLKSVGMIKTFPQVHFLAIARLGPRRWGGLGGAAK